MLGRCIYAKSQADFSINAVKGILTHKCVKEMLTHKRVKEILTHKRVKEILTYFGRLINILKYDDFQ